MHGLRKAFSTLSDVLIEEVDVIRSEAAEATRGGIVAWRCFTT